jgi:hypothetical protein
MEANKRRLRKTREGCEPMSRGSRLLGLVIAIVVLALTACQKQEPLLKKEIDLGEILPPSLQVYSIQRLDAGVGHPSEQLWLVLYRYDIADHFNPIAGVIYRADRGGKNRPRIIYPYPLQLPDRDYLGTGTVTVQTGDFLSAWSDSPELLVENESTDSIITEAAIFRWHDPFPDETWRTLRADGGVTVNRDEVIVAKLQGDRSQLARFYSYEPDERGSYLVIGAQLQSAKDSWIDFAFGPVAAEKVLDSPYPEKIVLAFHNALGGSRDALEPFLSEEGKRQLAMGLPGYGCDWPLEQVEQVTIHQISYYPGVEAQAEGEERQSLVELRLRCESRLPGTPPRDRQVGWLLKREGGQWKMDQLYTPSE